MFLDESLLDRLAKVAANPFLNWSYTNPRSITPTLPNDSVTTYSNLADVTDTSQNTGNTNSPEMIVLKSVSKRGRKRIHNLSSSEPEPKKIAIEPKNNKEKEKENKVEKEPKEQIQLQELYYATMEGDKDLILKEHKSSLHFKVCSKLIIIVIKY